jgi:hypothetical protein
MTCPSSNQSRAEFVRSARGANKQGVTYEQRIADREAKADQWAHWFRQRMGERGGNAIDWLPDALGELEARVRDEISGELRELKHSLMKALK